MKTFAVALLCTGVLCMGLSGGAFAATKPCAELKSEIEAKIQSAGVASYTLEVVSNDQVKDPNMVVGSCENGSRKVIYQKNDN